MHEAQLDLKGIQRKSGDVSEKQNCSLEKKECELKEKISWVKISYLGRNWHIEAKEDAWKSVWKTVKRGRAHFNFRLEKLLVS